jgi:hypothetical protein
MIQTIDLTDEQVAQTENPSADWLKLTPQQEALFKSCGPESGHRCILVGRTFARMPIDQMSRMMEAAFKSAAHAAARELGISTYSDEAASIEMTEAPAFGATHMSVRVTSLDGRSAVALGEIVLPSQEQYH